MSATLTPCATDAVAPSANPAASKPVHFHAPHKSPKARATVDQRVWTVAEIAALLELPFNDLMFQAQTIHRAHFDANLVELATLLSVKTGGCPEDCGYCPQSVHFDTGVEAGKLMGVEAVRAAALERKRGGAWVLGLAWSLGSTVLAVLAMVVSVPFWLVPPLILVLPPLIWG